MSDPKAAWDKVGDDLSDLGRKLQEHLEQTGPKEKAAADVQDALQKLGGAIDGALEGVGNAVRDPGIRDTVTKTAQSFRDALAASLREAGKNLGGARGSGPGESGDAI